MSTGNTKYGDGALENNTTTGGNNSAFGAEALRNSTQKWNTAVGAYSGLNTTTGISNVGLGTNSLLTNNCGTVGQLL